MRAMESRVRRVVLGEGGDVTLDITALLQYSGLGKCKKVTLYGDTAEEEDVRSWIIGKDWRIEMANEVIFVIRNDPCATQ